jgi:dihydrofolate reductase
MIKIIPMFFFLVNIYQIWNHSPQKLNMQLFMVIIVDNWVIQLQNIWGVVKLPFIMYLNIIMKLALTHQRKDQVVYHSLTYQYDKNSKLLFKKMVKIAIFVQKSLQLFGQFIKNNLFLQLQSTVTLKKLDSIPAFPVKSLQ